MAGVKGRSGGPRKNAGGARPGAGRKRKESAPPAAKKSANRRQAAVQVGLEPQGHGGALKRSRQTPVKTEGMDMLTYLQKVALGQVEATNIQVKAAVAAVQYTHAKVGEGGKKQKQQDEAAKVASRFAPAAAPRLATANGKGV